MLISFWSHDWKGNTSTTNVYALNQTTNDSRFVRYQNLQCVLNFNHVGSWYCLCFLLNFLQVYFLNYFSSLYFVVSNVINR